MDDAERLVRVLLDDPAVAGRLRDPDMGVLKPNYSGAFMVRGTWTDEPGDGAATGDPVIVKVGATPNEARWTRDIFQVDPGVVPTLYASGDAIGDEPLWWLVMERCPHVLGWQWGGVGYGMLLEAGVRFQLASRQIAPHFGPSDVRVRWFCDLVRRGLSADFPAPSGAKQLVANLEGDWAWVLSHSRVELCHGDLHASNAVTRAAPPDPRARALLIDLSPAALPWAYEPAYCEVLWWRTQTPNGEPTLAHAMAAIRERHGLEVPAPADLERLATLFLGWHALRFWPNERHRSHAPGYEAAARAYIAAAREVSG